MYVVMAITAAGSEVVKHRFQVESTALHTEITPFSCILPAVSWRSAKVTAT